MARAGEVQAARSASIGLDGIAIDSNAIILNNPRVHTATQDGAEKKQFCAAMANVRSIHRFSIDSRPTVNTCVAPSINHIQMIEDDVHTHERPVRAEHRSAPTLGEACTQRATEPGQGPASPSRPEATQRQSKFVAVSTCNRLLIDRMWTAGPNRLHQIGYRKPGTTT
jgi:hypothetical protein